MLTDVLGAFTNRITESYLFKPNPYSLFYLKKIQYPISKQPTYLHFHLILDSYAQ